jgi:peptide/nickel transport system substrate-binding protein
MKVLLPALCAPLLLVGCGGTAPEGAVLRVTVVGKGELAQRLEAEATQPTLIARDGAGQIVASLASSWRFVEEGRILILRLRPAKWSDGSELVSQDVVAAMRRAAMRREPALVHAGIEKADAIGAREAPPSKLGVRAPIARVVEVRLAATAPLLLDWLAEPGLAVTRPAREAATLAAYEASGPPDKRVLTRRDTTAAPDRQPSMITISSTADATPAISAFNRGETDIVMGNGLAGLGDVRSGVRPDVLRIDQLWGVYGYVANPRGALADPSLRRALGLAIDRQALARRFGLSALVPVSGLLPPSLGTPAPPVDLAAGRAEAQALLAAAGWTVEKPLRLTLLLPPGRDHRNVAEVVGADLATIGVALVVSEVADLPRAVARAPHDLALTEASISVPDAAALLARWRCGAGRHCNRAADDVLDQARTADPGEQPVLLAQAESLMMAGPPMLSLFTPLRWAIVARDVDGWTPNKAGSHPLARMQVSRK